MRGGLSGGVTVKIYVLFTMLVFAGVVPPLAHAQLNIPKILGNFPGIVSGVVPCGVGNSINLSTSAFPNATVQVRCNNIVVSSITTDDKGAFTMSVDLPSAFLSNLTSICNVFVATPLVTCNASLSSAGNLVAPIVSVFPNVFGTLFNIVTGTFRLQQTIT